MSSDDSESENEMDIDCTPPDLRSEAKLAMENLLPAKSKEKYMKVYENFMFWRNEKNAKLFSETVFLAYFNEIAKTKKPSTLWAIYSMLKCTVHIKNSIDLKNYGNLTTFLKRQSSGFKSKKSKILTGENIKQFLLEAPDDIYLATKVNVILLYLYILILRMWKLVKMFV